MKDAFRISIPEQETPMALLDLSLSSTTSARPTGLFRFAMHAAQIRRQRKALMRLDDAQLSDIGLTRTQVKAESQRPFWDVPATWRA